MKRIRTRRALYRALIRDLEPRPAKGARPRPEASPASSGRAPLLLVQDARGLTMRVISDACSRALGQALERTDTAEEQRLEDLYIAILAAEEHERLERGRAAARRAVAELVVDAPPEAFLRRGALLGAVRRSGRYTGATIATLRWAMKHRSPHAPEVKGRRGGWTGVAIRT